MRRGREHLGERSSPSHFIRIHFHSSCMFPSSIIFLVARLQQPSEHFSLPMEIAAILAKPESTEASTSVNQVVASLQPADTHPHRCTCSAAHCLPYLQTGAACFAACSPAVPQQDRSQLLLLPISRHAKSDASQSSSSYSGSTTCSPQYLYVRQQQHAPTPLHHHRQLHSINDPPHSRRTTRYLLSPRITGQQICP